MDRRDGGIRLGESAAATRPGSAGFDLGGARRFVAGYAGGRTGVVAVGGDHVVCRGGDAGTGARARAEAGNARADERRSASGAMRPTLSVSASDPCHTAVMTGDPGLFTPRSVTWQMHDS